MTERKPPGLSFESWIDRQVREAEERGEFADLPGSGKPLPDAHQPLDENWWIKQKLAAEGLTAMVHPTPPPSEGRSSRWRLRLRRRGRR
ncbi:DUF1992 domain-containing protein [Actinomadura syzygii]|uniref:DUF1992 domain-containing protein n=1 Tax=Actinomadura syzygii TaxID=1427538 RepID=A0A5D0ULX6_9ACTN|nr:DUF1992 domain-containing protein [Actinomadura syzygii]TYC18632.1 DUF1992 domain-containing protein [Actinomadura syzygii]